MHDMLNLTFRKMTLKCLPRLNFLQVPFKVQHHHGSRIICICLWVCGCVCIDIQSCFSWANCFWPPQSYACYDQYKESI